MKGVVVKIRVVFMGTPEFARPSLLKLIEDGHNVVAVFTQPDKPKGRGYTLCPPPIKELAQRLSIEVYQPKTLRDDNVLETLQALAPDLIVVVAYGKLLPLKILTLPPFGCINVHASLLPKYRGAAPIQWAIINGEKVTGVTTMMMDIGLDTGDILLKKETPIGEDETAGELHDRLAVMGAELLSETLKRMAEGTFERVEQRHAFATYAPMIDKTLRDINWSQPAEQINNLIRGLSPYPTAATTLKGKLLKIYRARPVSGVVGLVGEVNTENGFVVCCGDNTALEFLEVQYEGGRRMSAEEFLRGHPIEYGTVLE